MDDDVEGSAGWACCRRSVLYGAGLTGIGAAFGVTAGDSATAVTINDETEQDDVTEIEDWYDLDAVREDLAGDYVLAEDLDEDTAGYTAVAGPDANDGSGFEPIGTDDAEFTGTVDGQHNELRGLVIDRPAEDAVGLFARTGETAVITSISLVDSTVTGDGWVGGLVRVNTGTVVGSSVSGDITGGDSVGGVVGLNTGDVVDASASGAVGGDEGVGGLVGRNLNDGTVMESAASSDVTGDSAVGGLVGTNSGTVLECSASGDIDDGELVGGLVGRNFGEIESSWAAGTLVSNGPVGGLAGGNEGSVSSSWASGAVTGDEDVGGFIGHNSSDGAVTDSYWDTDASGTDDGIGSGDGSVTGLTTAEMHGAEAVQNMAALDFETTWQAVTDPDAYPVLHWQGIQPIADWHDLDAVRNDLDREYVLVDDLDETTAGYEEIAGPDANDGRGFEPIGDATEPFRGTFDGQHNEIRGLQINRPAESTVGLFGVTADIAEITSVTLASVAVTGDRVVGSLVGQNHGLVEAASTTGDVTGDHEVGGLVGANAGAVETSSTTGDSTVTGGHVVGGLVGAISDGGTIVEAFANAHVTGDEAVGGLTGWVSDGANAESSWAGGAVTGGTDVGGLAGGNEGSVSSSWASGAVTGDEDVGGLIGHNSSDGAVTDSYWDTDASGRNEGIGDGDGSVTGLSTAAMHGEAAAQNMAALDFEATWQVVTDPADYPILQWQDPSPVPIENWFQLAAVRDELDRDYVLLADLDDETAGYEEIAGPDANDGSGFEPIGDNDSAFTGTFDGQAYEIRDLVIDRSAESTVGLFGVTGESAVITGVTVADTAVTGDGAVGGLVGRNYGAVIESSTAGAVTGERAVGGLVGENFGSVASSPASGAVTVTGDQLVGGLVGAIFAAGEIVRSAVRGTLTGDEDVGGLVGRISADGTVVESSASADVTGEAWVGGLTGSNGGTVVASSASGAVTGDVSVGGLVGGNEGESGGHGVVRDSSATGAVTGEETVGGLVGMNGDGGTVEDATARGDVTGDRIVGGLVGANDGTVDSSAATADVTGDSTVGGLVGTNSQTGEVRNSFYNLETVRINGEQQLTIGGLFDHQYQDWVANDRELVLAEYDSLPLIDDWIELSDVQGVRDALGFVHDPGLNWRLQADLDLTEANAGIYFPYFTGVLAGNGHTVTLDIELPAVRNVGFVGQNRGQVLELTTGGTVTGEVRVGGVVGVNEAGKITSTATSCAVTGDDVVGGLVGENMNDGEVVDSSASGAVAGDEAIGGLVGRNAHDSGIDSSWTSGAVTGDETVGGLVGQNLTDSTVESSWTSGDVTGEIDIGCLVGINGGSVVESFVSGEATGDTGVGGLVGRNLSDGTVTGSFASGAVTGEIDVGGLVGSNTGAVVESFGSGAVTGEALVGGLVGANKGGTIESSLADGAVDGAEAVGGLVGGNMDYGWVGESSATGAVDGAEAVGGLVGHNMTDGSVVDTSAVGPVTGNEAVGGLVGTNSSEVASSWASGAVTGDFQVGGIIGANVDQVTGSYWDTDASGQDKGIGSGDGDVTGLTTAEMHGESAAEIMPTLDFEETWLVVIDPDDYPALRSIPDDPVDPRDPAFTVASLDLPDRRTGDPFSVSVTVEETVGTEPTEPTLSLTVTAVDEDHPAYEASIELPALADARQTVIFGDDSGTEKIGPLSAAGTDYTATATVESDDTEPVTASDSFSVGQPVTTTITLDAVNSSAWAVTAIDGDDATTLGEHNPTIELETATRYKIENNADGTQPLALLDGDGEPLLSQSENGSLEADRGINWRDDDDTVAFTLTRELANEIGTYSSTVDSTMAGDVVPQRTPAEYADPGSETVELGGVRTAIEDWQAGTAETDALIAVIEAWASGDSVI